MFISTEEEINVAELEQRLALQRDPLQRLLLLGALCSNYVYTNVDRARELLTEQCTLLDSHDLPDFRLDYWLHVATVHNQRYEYDEAAQALECALQLLDERGALKQQAEAYIDYAGVLINLSRLEEAQRWLERGERVLKNFPDQLLLARCNGRRGYLQLHIDDYAKAIELLLSAEKMITEHQSTLSLKDNYFLTLMLSGLGRVYEQNDEPEKSVQAYRRAVEISEKLGLSGRLAWHYLNTGNAYLALEDYDNAENYFRKTIAASDDLSGSTRAAAYANLGYCTYMNERYEEALELYDRAEALYRDCFPEDHGNFSNIAHWRGRLLFEQDRDDEALQQLNIAYEYARTADDTRRLASISKDIGALYAERENYQRAYQYQVEHDRLTELYVEQVDKRQQMELAVKYEAAKRQQETEMLKLQATRLQLKALRAQMNPHFLFNALNSIQSFISSNETGAATRFLAKFAKLMRQSLDYSEVEIISLEKEIEFLGDFLYINEKLRFEDKLSYAIEVDDEIEEDILGVPTMIVQPYVENAIEHGLRTRERGHILVRFMPLDDDTILCTVEDNGIGRERARQLRLADPRTRNHHSRGTNPTEKRLELLHRSREDQAVFVQTIDCYDSEGAATGTRVEIKIPIVEIQVK